MMTIPNIVKAEGNLKWLKFGDFLYLGGTLATLPTDLSPTQQSVMTPLLTGCALGDADTATERHGTGAAVRVL